MNYKEPLKNSDELHAKHPSWNLLVITTNALYYGDCLEWMQEWDDQSVDLIYLDPPFNSKANYNQLFYAEGGEEARLVRSSRRSSVPVSIFQIFCSRMITIRSLVAFLSNKAHEYANMYHLS